MSGYFLTLTTLRGWIYIPTPWKWVGFCDWVHLEYGRISVTWLSMLGHKRWSSIYFVSWNICSWSFQHSLSSLTVTKKSKLAHVERLCGEAQRLHEEWKIPEQSVTGFNALFFQILSLSVCNHMKIQSQNHSDWLFPNSSLNSQHTETISNNKIIVFFKVTNFCGSMG